VYELAPRRHREQGALRSSVSAAAMAENTTRMELRNSPVWSHASKRTEVERSRLIKDVAEFVSCIANLRCVDPLKSDPKAQSFLGLIVDDGDATFSHSHGCSTNIFERRAMEQNRKVLEERIDALCRFCDRYRFLLAAMARTYCEGGFMDDSIDLYPVVANDDLPSGGYFVRISLADAVKGASSVSTRSHPAHRVDVHEDRVTVGGFAIELARLLEDPIEKWIIGCESMIEALVPARDDCPRAGSRDAHRKRTLRKRLVRMLSEHLSMVGLFVASEGPAILLERQKTVMSTETMERLISDFADETSRDECETMRETAISQLQLLMALCGNEDPQRLAQLVAERQTSFLSVLRSPPSVLTRRPGYASCDFRFHTLRSIVMNTTSSTHSLTTVQLREWRHSIGRAAVSQLEQFLNDSIGILRKQRFPERGFLPTLRLVEPPNPTWTDATNASNVYMYTRAHVPLVTLRPDCHLRIPASTEQMLRLISLVWELMAYEETRDCYFTPGRVSVRYLREVISIEQVNVAFASMTLSSWKQKCGLGQTYRNAASAITHFRGADIEAHVREAFAKLCRWSLVDILSVVSEEHSPTFLSTQWKLVDAVAQSMRSGNAECMTVQCSSVLGRVLDVVEPVALALRSDVGLRSVARPHPLADLLRTIPAIRAWDGKSPELVLTVEDVMESKSKRIRALLQSLSDQRSIVHYGKLGRGRDVQKLGYGSKRVFRFNGNDLGAVLFGELLG